PVASPRPLKHPVDPIPAQRAPIPNQGETLMVKTKPRFRILALIAALALLGAACGSNKEDEGGSSGERSEDAPDMSDVSMTIGSKDFTENKLVAEMFAQAVEAGGGTVDRQIDLGGTNVNREALMSGEIDAYPEYNGTGWTVHLGH